MKYINPASFGRIDPKDWKKYPAFYTESIWPADLPSKPGDYGNNEFHGRTHPDIIKVALDRYTKPGDRVWDVFGGSGTTIDVCREYGNECIAYDVKPTRPDIIKADSRIAQPPLNIDLVVCHPPYMNIIDYGDEELSTDDWTRYTDNMYLVMDNITRALKDWHVLVIIIGVVWVNGEMVCLDYDMADLAYTFHYRLLGRIIRPFGETKGGKTAGAKNTNLWKYRRLKYGIWELGQDVVQFWQKVPTS